MSELTKFDSVPITPELLVTADYNQSETFNVRELTSLAQMAGFVEDFNGSASGDGRLSSFENAALIQQLYRQIEYSKENQGAPDALTGQALGLAVTALQTAHEYLGTQIEAYQMKGEDGQKIHDLLNTGQTIPPEKQEAVESWRDIIQASEALLIDFSAQTEASDARAIDNRINNRIEEGKIPSLPQGTTP